MDATNLRCKELSSAAGRWKISFFPYFCTDPREPDHYASWVPGSKNTCGCTALTLICPFLSQKLYKLVSTCITNEAIVNQNMMLSIGLVFFVHRSDPG